MRTEARVWFPLSNASWMRTRQSASVSAATVPCFSASDTRASMQAAAVSMRVKRLRAAAVWSKGLSGRSSSSNGRS